jgi:hypothetical protein
MSVILKWEKAKYIVFAAGIIGFAAYGIGHTAFALNELKNSQNTCEMTSTCICSEDVCPDIGGGSCSAAGCAGCGGCVKALYQEETAVPTGVETPIVAAY